MASVLAGMLPGLLEQGSQSPLGINNLLNLGAYELYGRGMETERFNRQLELQRNAFGQQTAQQNSGQNFQTQLQTNQFQNNNFALGQTLQHNENMQQLKTKGALLNTAAQGGISAMNQGFGLLGNYLNYTYNTKLQDQAFSNQKSLFNTQADRITSEFEKGGMPGWAAFSGGNLTSAVPHSTQVLSGINARTASLPGKQTSFYANTGSQTSMGLGVVSVG